VPAQVELPEVETVRRDLDREIGGKKIKSVEAMGMKALSRYKNRKAFTSQLEGRKVGSVARRGVHLVFDIGDGELLVTILGTGRFRRQSAREPLEPDTQVVITFTQGGQLRFIDRAGEGDMFVVPKDELVDALPELSEPGFDPVEHPVSWTYFGQRLVARGDEKLKLLLTDPTFIVGLGDVYSDEILHDALLRGDREPSTLSTQEIRRLYRSIVETMHNAIKYRGTSTEANGWVDVHGDIGGYGEFLEVYGRDGQRSHNGRGEVHKSKIGGHDHYHADYQV
jgi:formamidopyrimidine-DNA glycosylase